ncbi:MAG: glutamate racemase, partial [Patescibacteria group bacterium]
MRIGVFDSGLGGLTILKELIKELPHHDYIYLGDNARSPYGDRSFEDITAFTRQGVDFLISKQCEVVIIACNSASAVALPGLVDEYTKKGILIQGVIEPMIDYLIK